MTKMLRTVMKQLFNYTVLRWKAFISPTVFCSAYLECMLMTPTLHMLVLICIWFSLASLSPDLEKLSNWLMSNRLTLNATKTEFMFIGSRRRLSTLSDALELSIDNVPIEQVTSVKSLGIYIDENLTWHSHIDKLCTKIASGAIKRVKPFVPQSTLLNIYNSLVQSHFDYCSLVWGNCGKTLSNKLQKLQNRAARVITSSNFDVDIDYLFHKLSWKDLRMKSQRQIQNALMVFKSLDGLVPEYLTSKFIKRNE